MEEVLAAIMSVTPSFTWLFDCY